MDRRDLLTGIVAGAFLSGPAIGAATPTATPDQLFANTPFANNRVARLFTRVDMHLPDTRIIGKSGPTRLRSIARGPRLLTLWSEWCVPCLIEARDLALARPRVTGDGFEIISLLSGSAAKLDYTEASARLTKAGAPGLTLFVEPNGGHAVANVLAADPIPPSSVRTRGAQAVKSGGYALPCTVLIDRKGHVRARATGIPTIRSTPRSPGAVPVAGTHPLSDTDKQEMMAGTVKTAWATSDGEAFLLALRGGLLDHV